MSTEKSLESKVVITVNCSECGQEYELTLKPKIPKTLEEMKKDFEKWQCSDCKMAGNRRFADSLNEGSGVHFGRY